MRTGGIHLYRSLSDGADHLPGAGVARASMRSRAASMVPKGMPGADDVALRALVAGLQSQRALALVAHLLAEHPAHAALLAAPAMAATLKQVSTPTEAVVAAYAFGFAVDRADDRTRELHAAGRTSPAELARVPLYATAPVTNHFDAWRGLNASQLAAYESVFTAHPGFLLPTVVETFDMQQPQPWANVFQQTILRCDTPERLTALEAVGAVRGAHDSIYQLHAAELIALTNAATPAELASWVNAHVRKLPLL